MAGLNRFGGKVVHVENLDKVARGLNEFQRKNLGKATAKAFGRTAKKGVIAGKRELRSGLENRSRYITSGVKGQPITSGQQTAFANSFNKNFIADGSVYIRGANTQKRELDFLMDHEHGTKRKAKSKTMAIPLKGLREWKGGDHRTTRGATKKRLKPKALLELSRREGRGGREYNKIEENSYLVVRTGKTNKPQRRGKVRRRVAFSPYIINSGGGKHHRKSHKGRNSKMIFLYKFQKTTQQTNKINWGDKVEESIRRNLRGDIIRQVRKVLPYQVG